MSITDVAISRYHNGTGGRAFRNSGDDKTVGAHDNRAFVLSEFHFWAKEFLRAQARAHDADFAAGKGRRRSDRVNARSTICVLSTENAI
jgi:hypothetical protein